MKKHLYSIVFYLIMSLSFSTTVFAEAMSQPAIDSHLHYQDFTQNSEGFSNLALAMKAINVEGAIIFGMPMTKMWDENAPDQPSYYMSNDSRSYYFSATDYIMIEELKKYRQKSENTINFYPFACGVNANDKYAGDQLLHLFKIYPNMFYGIGEIMLRHDDLTALTYGEAPRPNSPGMFSIIDTAAKFNMPVLIHHNISASYEKTEALYRKELEELLKYAAKKEVNIIWAHVGASRRIALSNESMLQHAKELLSTYPRLYMDISWVIYDDFINANPENLNAWAKLIRDNPTRLLIGSDKVGKWGKNGADYQKEILKYNNLATAIKDTVVIQSLYKNNVLRLLPKKPNH